MLKKNTKYWNSKEYISTNISVGVDDALLIRDTYVASDGSYSDSDGILYSATKTLKIGGNSTKYRTVLVCDIGNYLQNRVSSFSGYAEGMDYSVLNAELIVSSSKGQTFGSIYAIMLPTDTDMNPSWTDEPVLDPFTQGISVAGNWIGSEIVFNITPFVNVWKSSGAETFAIMLKSDENSEEILEIHSQQADSPPIGNKPQNGVRFLGAGDTNFINTEGIVVKLSPIDSYLSIESVDSSPSGSNKWSAFNASISIGDTFSMFLPDLLVQNSIYTLLDKRTRENGDIQMIASGSTTGIEATTHATGEFSCIGKVQSGSGIVEFANPDNSLMVDLNTIVSGNVVIFDYKPTMTPNNAGSFTVDFYSNETFKNNRSRLYLKEQTASENRSGLNTVVKKLTVRPRLSFNLFV